MCKVFRDDLHTDLARRCVAHPLGRVATSSLSFFNVIRQTASRAGAATLNETGGRGVGPSAPPAIVPSNSTTCE
jgi:hypothetical protein